MPATAPITIISPIFFGDKTQAVADLQNALIQLGYPIIKDVGNGFLQETCLALTVFKKKYNIAANACYIDQQTLDALNGLLTSQNPNQKPETFSSLPIVFGDTSLDVKKLQVLLEVAGFGEITGEEATNGSFGTDTCAEVTTMKTTLKVPAYSCYLDKPTAAQINQLLAPIPDGQTYTVSGYVLNSQQEKIPGQFLMAYDIDLKGARLYRTAKTLSLFNSNGGVQLLGTAVSDATGFYEIKFNSSAFQQNEFSATDTADVIALAFQSNPGQNQRLPDDNNPIVGRSALSVRSNYTGTSLLNWNVLLQDSTIRGASEFAQLMGVLNPFLQMNQVGLADIADSGDQISFLSTETSQVLSACFLAAQAGKLEQDCSSANQSKKASFTDDELNILVELFYGIGRQNISLTWVTLLQNTATQLTQAVNQSISQNIIGQQNAATVSDCITKITGLSSQQAAGAPEAAVFYKTIGFAVKDTVLQLQFASAYTQFSGEPAVFWTKLAGEAGFTPQVIQSLQLTNQLSILTGQHTPLIEELQVNRAFTNISDLLSLKDEDWNTIIQKTGVPAQSPGSTVPEQQSLYIQSIKNILYATFPTKKIALMTAAGDIAIKDANIKERLNTFFTSATDFDISTTRVTDTATDKIVKQISGDLYSSVQQQLLVMQRIFQVSPTPEVLGILLSKGYTSAYHISSKSQSTFISEEASDLGGAGVAFSVYNRARHQVMRAQHVLLRIRDTQDQAIPTAVISTQQKQTITSFLNTLNA